MADDRIATRQYVWDQWQYLYGTTPTEFELEFSVNYILSTSRLAWMRVAETRQADSTVKRIFDEVLGREPNAQELGWWTAVLQNNVNTRTEMRSYLSSTHEARTRAVAPPGPTAEQEDSRDQVNEVLARYGLESLGTWAWEQIVAGHSPTRVLQDLRQTDTYKARFSGLIQRVENGLPAMTESEYLAYEEGAEQIMRSNGLPAQFRNQEAYAELIASNVSLVELDERVTEGFVRVNTAPVEVRDKYAEWFGPAGDAALAAFFLDPDRALPVLRQQIATAEVGGIGDQFDLDFTYARASRIAEAGVDADRAREGFSQLQQLDPLFNETVSEERDLAAVDEGADAVFNLGGDGATALERRSRARTAATSGGGGAAVGSTGTGIGSAD